MLGIQTPLHQQWQDYQRRGKERKGVREASGENEIGKKEDGGNNSGREIIKKIKI